MNTRSAIGSLAIAFVLFSACNASAAPIPPLGPVDITGTVVQAQWIPEQKIKGIPGMSGTLGIDRVKRAHFVVALEQYEGVDAKTARQMTGYLDASAPREPDSTQAPQRILMQLDHEDKEFLKKGMRITVKGYKIAGDEGGTWTSYEEIRK
jgi:hypothetical protein